MSTVPGGNDQSDAESFVHVLRAMIRTSARIQEIFYIREASAVSMNEPMFIVELEAVLKENMDWIKPLMEHHMPGGVQEARVQFCTDEDQYITADECSLEVL